MPEISVDIESKRPVIAANLEELRYLVFYGMTGDDGKSAYELAVELGFEGTEQEWLESLQGADGKDGEDGKNYGIVVDGSVDHILELKSEESPDGKSAYEIAVENGFEGTETEWLESLQGEDGKNYGIVVDGSVDEVLKLKSVPASGEGGPIIIDDAPTSGSQNAVSSGGVYTALAGKTDSSSLATVATTGSYNDLSDKPTIPASATVDATPTSGSGNAVSSGGVYTALAGKQNTLTFDSAPTQNSQNPVTSGGVYTALQNVGGVGWADVSNDFGFADSEVKYCRAYYCAALGIVRFIAHIRNNSSSTSTSSYFTMNGYYKPYADPVVAADVTNSWIPAYGAVMASPDSYVDYDRYTAAVGRVRLAYSEEYRLYIRADFENSTYINAIVSGFYYTEDIPTGGES